MTVYLINRLKKSNDLGYIFDKVVNSGKVETMYKEAYEADLEWIDYTYPEGTRLLGINNQSAKIYSQYNTYNVMQGIGLVPTFINRVEENPMKWLNEFKNISSVQVAQKETSGLNYLVGSINKDTTDSFYENLQDI